MSLMIIAVILVYIRCKVWVKFERENSTYADLKKHQKKLLIYAIIFAVGFFIFAVEIIYRKYL